ncbi:MAG TPA: TrpB-like pyridoxal phosphate-dependent enzyme [Candidatus Binatia bacterium]|nr:TrpB-like pyridoxal phosphate-dependent enzyme [Candidatus Binatia bacterium]
MEERRIQLSTRDLPEAWYNLAADLPESVPPHRHPATGQPVTADDMRAIFPPALIEQEVSTERWIAIPEPVREQLTLWRPTPLVRARNLERHLGTPARIYFKNESVSPAGSHKPNTAVAQAYYNKIAGIARLSTETGAGQWGSSLAFACRLFGLQCKVYMVKVSYHQKPYRRSLMQLWGADVVASPSRDTEAGRAILERDAECSGSLGIAISEAVEDAATRADTNYALGSVLNHVCLHQTVVGLETQKQLALAGERPDVMIGCAGGGSNLSGLIFPFVADTLAGRGPRLVAVEPAACPSLTRGQYAYDFGDTAGMAPMARMYTLGHTFMPSGIHAGGLRYHGMSPIVSLLRHRNVLAAVSYKQNEVFEAAVMFARTEGICPAPETAHAIRAAIDEALRCKEVGQGQCIVFNLSGHGYFDLASYDKYLAGELEDFELPQREIDQALQQLPTVPSD